VARARLQAQSSNGGGGDVEMAELPGSTGGGGSSMFPSLFQTNPLQAPTNQRRGSMAFDRSALQAVHVGAAAAKLRDDLTVFDEMTTAAVAGAAVAVTNLFAPEGTLDNFDGGGEGGEGGVVQPPPSPTSALATRLQDKQDGQAARGVNPLLAAEGGSDDTSAALAKAPVVVACGALATGFGPQGSLIADFVLAVLPKELTNALRPFFPGANNSDGSSSGTDPTAGLVVKEQETEGDVTHRHSYVPRALRDAYLATNASLTLPKLNEVGKELASGACVVACVVAEGFVHVAIVGDCRALLCRNGRAVPLGKPQEGPPLRGLVANIVDMGSSTLQEDASSSSSVEVKEVAKTPAAGAPAAAAAPPPVPPPPAGVQSNNTAANTAAAPPVPPAPAAVAAAAAATTTTTAAPASEKEGSFSRLSASRGASRGGGWMASAKRAQQERVSLTGASPEEDAAPPRRGSLTIGNLLGSRSGAMKEKESAWKGRASQAEGADNGAAADAAAVAAEAAGGEGGGDQGVAMYAAYAYEAVEAWQVRRTRERRCIYELRGIKVTPGTDMFFHDTPKLRNHRNVRKPSLFQIRFKMNDAIMWELHNAFLPLCFSLFLSFLNARSISGVAQGLRASDYDLGRCRTSQPWLD